MPKMACCKDINRKKTPGIVPFGAMPGFRIQFHSSAKRKSRIFRCLIPFRLISNSSRETTYFGKLSQIFMRAWNLPQETTSEL